MLIAQRAAGITVGTEKRRELGGIALHIWSLQSGRNPPLRWPSLAFPGQGFPLR